MAKFIIIDNSIENTVGHHYQYAAHCLLAAKDRNFAAILAANKRFKPPNTDSWETISIYHHGFWGARRKRERKLVDLDRSLSTRINFLKHNALFSRIGLTLENRSILFNQVKLPGIEDSVYTSHPRSWIMLSSILVPIYLLSTRMPKSIYNFKRRVYTVAAGSNKIDPITGVGIDSETSHIFAQDTTKLFKKLKLQEKDIVFMPTVGINEMLGLAEAVRNLKVQISINLLFRRNIYTGKEHEYWKQDEDLRLLRNIFTNFVQGLESHNIFFYTDTDELTVQYNRLGTSLFHTLPVPHTVPPAAYATETPVELFVTYIGDARTEKGFHHLPHIISDVRNKVTGPKKLKFVIQSNYNIPKGEPKTVVARSQLEALQSENIEGLSVRLIYDPLSFEDYIQLLLSTNIMLLPYDTMQYYARSSGILVECLAAGIPVIVPAGTWMSRQFASESNKHNEWLRNTLAAEEIVDANNIRWKRRGSEESPSKNGEIIFGGEQAKAYCRLVKPGASRSLFLRFSIIAQHLPAIKVDLVQLRYDESMVKFTSSMVEKFKTEMNSLFLPLDENCQMIWLGFKSAFGNAAVSITNLEVAFLRGQEIGTSFPSGSVGLTYEQPDQIPDLLSEMVRHYTHYRRSALEFSRDYSKTHNAFGLIEKMLEVSNK